MRYFFRKCNKIRRAASVENDDEAVKGKEKEEETVADKRTSNVAAGQSELWDN